ncbi:hypothetical protein GMA8713_03615 [Grimontia marina]|uniref:Uncharacterized protein n=2 Tax=Grimontia marina TaxID=646534 RepID=A0A128FFI6_9GAMM|nr:hypothetical protein GMA8713_03615 [Grimontia marina]
MIVGLTALSAHFCMTKAMQYAEVSTVVILDFLRLPAIGMVGALIMLFGNLLMMLKEVSRKYEAV